MVNAEWGMVNAEWGMGNKAPDAAAYRTDLAQQALDGLADADTKGESFQK